MFLSLLQFFATKFLFLALHLESGSFPRPLSPQAEIKTFSALREGDPSAREKLIRHNLRLVAHIAKKYYALPGEQDDLISIGTIGLMKAVDTFDSTRRARFSTYASRCIENELRMHFRRERKNAPTLSLQETLEAGKENPHSYADIPNPWDRLRWCRYGLDLLQKEVAAMVGMEEWLYRDLESGAFHRSFTPELADKLAALYGIPVEDILDDYTLFLHRGGGAFLRRYREAKGWNRQQLADHAKVSRTSIRCWENGQKTISQKCFCHLVENLGSDFPSMLRM